MQFEKNIDKTSLKSQKFTWPLAYVYISFVKLKNICSWFFPVLFKKMIFLRFFIIFHVLFMILNVLLHFWKKYSYFISFFKKNIHDFSRFFMFYSKSWMMYYHILFKNHSCFIHDFHKIFKIFQDFSGFLKIFHVLFKILNNFLLHFIKKIFMFY